jgi:hypothetical protein
MIFSEIGVYSATTVEEWTSVLDLAAKWKFESIRAFAIKQLESIASPIDKIVIGRKHNILDWLVGAYGAVCERTDALTLVEATLLGMEDVVKISSLRQDIRDGRFGLPKASVAVLRGTFVLESLPEPDLLAKEVESCRSYTKSPVEWEIREAASSPDAPGYSSCDKREFDDGLDEGLAVTKEVESCGSFTKSLVEWEIREAAPSPDAPSDFGCDKREDGVGLDKALAGAFGGGWGLAQSAFPFGPPSISEPYRKKKKGKK